METFQISQIKARRTKLTSRRTKRVEYLVAWAGYGDKHDSWEPEHRLKRDAPDAIKEFADGATTMTSTSTAWRKTGSEHVGAEILRSFDGQHVHARVVKWAKAGAGADEPALWHVVHDDGDEEDLELDEVVEARAALQRQRKKRQRGQNDGEEVADTPVPDAGNARGARASGEGISPTPAAANDSGLSLYERVRLQNIERNREAMQLMGLNANTLAAVSSATGLASKAAGTKKKAAPSTLKRRKVARAPIPESELRRSARSAGKSAPDYSVEKVLHGGRVVVGGSDKEALVAEAASQKVESAKQRWGREIEDGPLKLESTGGTEEYGSRFLTTLRELAAKAAEDGGDEASEGTGKAAQCLGVGDLEYAERLSKATIGDGTIDADGEEGGSLAKVVHDRIYGLGFLPTPHKLIVAAGDKEGNLGLWNVDERGDEGEPVVSLYEPHSRPLNEISFDARDPTKLYTMGYDCSVRMMDVTKECFEQVAVYRATAKLGDPDAWLQHGALTPDGNCYLMAASDGCVAGVDLRSGKEILRAQVHDKKVNTVSCSAASAGTSGSLLFCTASLDRSVKLWDSRYLKQKASPKPVWEHACSRSVNSAFFNTAGDRIISVHQANHLSLFQAVRSKAGAVQPDVKVRHDNQTGRYLAVFRAVFDPKTPYAFVVGSMSKPRQVEVYSAHLPGEEKAKKARITRIMSLQDPEWMASVQSRNCFHSHHDIVACANASGKVHIFRDHRL